jgi:hypothetical protein
MSETQPVNVDEAREKWKDHLTDVWGGAGSWLHGGAEKVQQAAGLAMVGSAPTLAIPVVGEIVEGSELLAYTFASAVKGAVRTSAENHAVTKAGGTDQHMGGVGTFFGNTFKSLIPV